MSDIRFSYSSVQTWMKCRQAFAYRYVQGLESLVQDARPQIGSAVHFALAMSILQGDDDENIAESLRLWVEEEMEKYNHLPVEIAAEFELALRDQVAQAHPIARRALSSVDRDAWETVRIGGEPAVEWAFERTVPGIGVFQGQIDWVARHRPTGLIWLWDYKIRQQFSSHSMEEYNTQMAVYQHVLQEDVGLELAGSITFEVSSKLPRRPDVNKNGTLSRAAINTDWATYLQAIHERGQNPLDYEDMRLKLQDKVFYRALPNYRNRATTQRIWGQFIRAAVDMRSVVNGGAIPQVYRSMAPFNCRPCSYNVVCMGQLRDDDVEYLIKNHYRYRGTSTLVEAVDMGGYSDDGESQSGD